MVKGSCQWFEHNVPAASGDRTMYVNRFGAALSRNASSCFGVRHVVKSLCMGWNNKPSSATRQRRIAARSQLGRGNWAVACCKWNNEWWISTCCNWKILKASKLNGPLSPSHVWNFLSRRRKTSEQDYCARTKGFTEPRLCFFHEIISTSTSRNGFKLCSDSVNLVTFCDWFLDWFWNTTITGILHL